MTFEQIQNLVLERTKRSDKLAHIQLSLNLALTEYGQVRDWNALRASADLPFSTGANTVACPSFFGKALSARMQDSAGTLWRFHLIGQEQFERKYAAVQTTWTGRPVVGYVRGAVIQFLPYSNGDYTLQLKYYSKFTEFAAAGDPCPIPGLENALAAYATAEVFRSIQLLPQAEYWEGQATRALSNAIRDERRQPGIETDKEEFSVESDDPIVDPAYDPFVMRDPNVGGW